MKESNPTGEISKNLLEALSKISQPGIEIDVGTASVSEEGLGMTSARENLFVRDSLAHYLGIVDNISDYAKQVIPQLFATLAEHCSIVSCSIMVWENLIVVEHTSGICVPICFTDNIRGRTNVRNSERTKIVGYSNIIAKCPGTTDAGSECASKDSLQGSKPNVIKNQSNESRVRLSESWVDDHTVLKGDTIIWFAEDGKEVRGIANPYVRDRRGELVMRNDGTIEISYKGGSIVAKRSQCFLVQESKDSGGKSNAGSGDGSKTISTNSRSSSARAGFDPPSGPSQPGHESFESATDRGAYTGDRQSWNGYAQAAAVAERDCK